LVLCILAIILDDLRNVRTLIVDFRLPFTSVYSISLPLLQQIYSFYDWKAHLDRGRRWKCGGHWRRRSVSCRHPIPACEPPLNCISQKGVCQGLELPSSCCCKASKRLGHDCQRDPFLWWRSMVAFVRGHLHTNVDRRLILSR
jgi:hypothetical protein